MRDAYQQQMKMAGGADKEAYEAKQGEQAEKRTTENAGDSQNAMGDEIDKAVKEDMDAASILRGVAICEAAVDSKLGKALNKYIELYAPNHTDSTLQQRINLHNAN